jgi:hypothetical protein
MEFTEQRNIKSAEQDDGDMSSYVYAGFANNYDQAAELVAIYTESYGIIEPRNGLAERIEQLSLCPEQKDKFKDFMIVRSMYQIPQGLESFLGEIGYDEKIYSESMQESLQDAIFASLRDTEESEVDLADIKALSKLLVDPETLRTNEAFREAVEEHAKEAFINNPSAVIELLIISGSEIDNYKDSLKNQFYNIIYRPSEAFDILKTYEKYFGNDEEMISDLKESQIEYILWLRSFSTNGADAEAEQLIKKFGIQKSDLTELDDWNREFFFSGHGDIDETDEIRAQIQTLLHDPSAPRDKGDWC